MGGFQEAVLYVLKVILVDKHTPQTNFDPFGLLELVSLVLPISWLRWLNRLPQLLKMLDVEVVLVGYKYG